MLLFFFFFFFDQLNPDRIWPVLRTHFVSHCTIWDPELKEFVNDLEVNYWISPAHAGIFLFLLSEGLIFRL